MDLTQKREHQMNWTIIGRCTAVAIGATFVAAAIAFAAIRLFASLRTGVSSTARNTGERSPKRRKTLEILP